MSEKPTEPKWLSLSYVMMLHNESLNLFGGSPRLRDKGLLESAMDRPRNKWAYEQAVSLFELAAAYAFGIAKNHSFIDGNKRTAFLSIRTFLFLNGYKFSPPEVESVTIIEGLASGVLDETLLTNWIEENSQERS